MAINKLATANSDYERIVIASSIASRLLLLFLIVFWRSLLSPYDTSASLNPACLINPSSSPLPEHPVLFPRIGSAIESSIVWDGVHFVRIAQCGYEYEKSYAFLPLLPFCISLLSRTGYGSSNAGLNSILLQSCFYILFIVVLISGAFNCICIFAPFIAFQAYGYYNICGGRIPDEMRPWCKARVPLLYNFVQSHYWGVGFLRYFRFEQLPNFLLASPILSLAFFSIVHYGKSKTKLLFSVGFQATADDRNSAAMLYFPESISRSSIPHPTVASSSGIQGNQNLRRRKKIIEQDPAELPVEDEPSKESGYFSALVLPFILHMGFMAATAFFIMHVQVATRFLSASPPLYWFASYITVSPHRFKRWGYIIWAYSVAYILLGSLLFSNFYPFT